MRVNFFVTSKFAHNYEGIIPESELIEKFKSNEEPAYYCAFNAEDEQLKTEEGKPTFKGYDGLSTPALGYVVFDFDDAENPQNSLDDMNKFIEEYEVENHLCFYSGNKGFHLYVPMPEIQHICCRLKKFASKLNDDLPTLDVSVYNANRKMRAPFSKHEKTGRFKNQIFTLGNGIDFIIDYCKDRIVTDIPTAIPSNQTLYNEIKCIDVTPKSEITVKIPTNFDKKCINKLLGEMNPIVSGCNEKALRIVNHYHQCNRPRSETLMIAAEWEVSNADLGYYTAGVFITMVNEIYDGVKSYDYGCNDPLMQARCSIKCKTYKNLDPKTKMIPSDASEAQAEVIEKNKLLKEFEVAHKILTEKFGCGFTDTTQSFFDGHIIKQDRDVFVYNGKRWVHQIWGFDDKIKNLINAIYKYKQTSRAVDSAYKTFLRSIPHSPVDMFKINPFICNVNNGTIHIIPENKKFIFREHNILDYAINVLDIDYKPGEVNYELDTFIERTLPDGDKINLLTEMFGASLFSLYPRIFLLYGVPKTGKSTAMLIAKKLINDDNFCQVGPNQLKGFNLETMAGKMVNMVTEIDTTNRINDSVLKQIEDRDNFRIDRKGLKAIYAPLPAVHIFGANELPKTFDNTGAHNRRWSIIEFDQVFKGEEIRDIAGDIFNSSASGVLNFALRGVQRILNNGGFFTQSKRSSELIKEMTATSDVVGNFLGDIKEDDVQKYYCEMDDDKRCKRTLLYKTFVQWCEDSGLRNTKINKFKFMALLRQKGFSEIKSDGAWYFKGIYVQERQPNQ